MALEIEGIRKNSKLYLDCENHYSYTCKRKTEGTYYLKCWTDKCPVAASMKVLEHGGFGAITTKENAVHTHGPDESFIEVIELRRRLIQRAKDEPYTRLRKIYDEECNK